MKWIRIRNNGEQDGERGMPDPKIFTLHPDSIQIFLNFFNKFTGKLLITQNITSINYTSVAEPKLFFFGSGTSTILIEVEISFSSSYHPN